jgi:hypothetical protein
LLTFDLRELPHFVDAIADVLSQALVLVKEVDSLSEREDVSQLRRSALSLVQTVSGQDDSEISLSVLESEKIRSFSDCLANIRGAALSTASFLLENLLLLSYMHLSYFSDPSYRSRSRGKGSDITDMSPLVRACKDALLKIQGCSLLRHAVYEHLLVRFAALEELLGTTVA